MPQANKPDNDVLAGLGGDTAAATTPPAGQGQSYDKAAAGAAPDVKIVSATELSPDAAYLIVLDENVYTQEEAAQLMDSLAKIGIKNAVAMSAPHDKAIRIIKQDPEKKDV